MGVFREGYDKIATKQREVASKKEIKNQGKRSRRTVPAREGLERSHAHRDHPGKKKREERWHSVLPWGERKLMWY